MFFFCVRARVGCVRVVGDLCVSLSKELSGFVQEGSSKNWLSEVMNAMREKKRPTERDDPEIELWREKYLSCRG